MRMIYSFAVPVPCVRACVCVYNIVSFWSVEERRITSASSHSFGFAGGHENVLQPGTGADEAVVARGARRRQRKVVLPVSTRLRGAYKAWREAQRVLGVYVPNESLISSAKIHFGRTACCNML